MNTTDIYDPTLGNAATAKLLAKARKVNAKRDKDDGGFPDASLGGLALHLRTIMTAIGAGLNTNDQSAIFEGLGMLQDAELAVRKMAAR